MKLLLVFAAFVYASFAVPITKNEANQRFIEVIGGDDQIHKVDLEETVDYDLLDEINRNSGNRYLLFTRSNPSSSQLLQINNAGSITSSNFNARVPTIVVAHGWFSNHNTNLNPVIREAFLKFGDVNVIILDWSNIAMGSYINSIVSIPAVGRALGQFLAFLNSVTGASFDSMHLIGFSLGSHVVGNAGRELRGRVGRVTGLDPVSPAWENNSNRLSRTDGVYVEIIHTNGPTLGGVNGAIGDTDFYPNGGSSQPGCVTSVCNHNRSWELFAATVTYNHLPARRCSSTQEIVSNTCQGNTLHMGNGITRKTGSGLYRLVTASRYPF